MGIQEYLDSLRTTSKARSEISSVTTGAGGTLSSTGSPVSSYLSRAADGMIEEVNSLNHPHWRYAKGRARDVGGPFFKRKARMTSSGNIQSFESRYGSGKTYQYYNGPVYPSYPTSLLYSKSAASLADGVVKPAGLWTSDNALPRADLRAEGLKFMLSARPHSPAYSLANSLGELLSEKALFGIPFKALARHGEGALPAEYLNLQFGILPVVSDVRDYLDASAHSGRIMAQMYADDGKIIRREREKPWSINTTTTVYGNATSQSQLLAPPSTVLPVALTTDRQLTVTTSIERKLWFAGAYQFYLPPEGQKFLRDLAYRNAVYGFLPTPSTLWELTPFSWLTDWALNTNDAIEGMFSAGLDGTVLIRGYVMCKTIARTEMTWTGRIQEAGSWRRATMSWTVEETILQRERTRPYGLDWKNEGLTPKQISILTALGLSRR